MSRSIDPCEYFISSNYQADKRLYDKYTHEIEKLNAQERKQRLAIIDTALVDVNDAIGFPLKLIGIIGTVVSVITKAIELFSNEYWPFFNMGMALYFSIAVIIMLFRLMRIAKKKAHYTLYRLVLTNIMGREGELKTKFEGYSTLSLGTLDCRIVNNDS